MTARPRDSRDAQSFDGTPYVIGVSLGIALATAVILLVLVGTVWPLLALLVLAGAAAGLTPALQRSAPRAAAAGERAAPTRSSFRDWNNDIGVGGEPGVAAVAPLLGSATAAAKSTFVDTHA